MHWIKRTIASIPLEMCGIPLGDDLSIVIWGGDRAHVGASVLAQLAPAKNGGDESPAVFVLTLPGHKEEVLFREIASRAAQVMKGTVSVTGGIHIDGADKETIGSVCAETRDMLEELLRMLRFEVKLD